MPASGLADEAVNTRLSAPAASAAAGTTYCAASCCRHAASDTPATRHAFSWSPECAAPALVRYSVRRNWFTLPPTSRPSTSYARCHVCAAASNSIARSSCSVGTDCGTVTRNSLSMSTTRLIVASIAPSVARALPLCSAAAAPFTAAVSASICSCVCDCTVTSAPRAAPASSSASAARHSQGGTRARSGRGRGGRRGVRSIARRAARLL